MPESIAGSNSSFPPTVATEVAAHRVYDHLRKRQRLAEDRPAAQFSVKDKVSDAAERLPKIDGNRLSFQSFFPIVVGIVSKSKLINRDFDIGRHRHFGQGSLSAAQKRY
jgi:hypothetical protein